MHKVRQAIKDGRLLEKGERILVGVSGGADSVALLTVLHELSGEEGWELHVAHVEHGLRGEESLADAEFVKRLCGELRLPFHLGQPDVKNFARKKRVSIQVAARELRYAFFLETARAVGAAKLALAHHADDQAETVLMRILRGTSVSGLAGIPLRRQLDGLEIVRPLLDVWRDEIEEYCARAQIRYRTDSSNALTGYFRNKIRLQLMPLLRAEYNENVKKALVQLGKIASAEDEYLTERAARLLEQAVAGKSSRTATLKVRVVLNAPLALQRRAITLILYYLCGHTKEWEAKHIEQILELAAHSMPSARIHLPGGIQAWRQYDLLHIGKREEMISSADAIRVTLPVPRQFRDSNGKLQFFEVPGLNLRGSIELLEGAVASAGPWEAVFDYDAVRGRAFQIRTRRRGDIMRPLGMTGTKRLKEVFMEARIPREQRDLWPIWVLGEEIAWVTGIRRGNVAIVHAQTRQTLRVRVNMQSSSVT